MCYDDNDCWSLTSTQKYHSRCTLFILSTTDNFIYGDENEESTESSNIYLYQDRRRGCVLTSIRSQNIITASNN